MWKPVALVLVGLLVFQIISKLAGIHSLLLPSASAPTRVSFGLLLLRKMALVLYGAIFLVLSQDKVSKKDLRRARAANAESHGARGVVDREVCACARVCMRVHLPLTQPRARAQVRIIFITLL